jgi:hypothetical protein
MDKILTEIVILSNRFVMFKSIFSKTLFIQQIGQ